MNMEVTCFNCGRQIEVSEEYFYSTEPILCDECIEQIETTHKIDDSDLPY
jgi:NMD protein affecting ribosome stability and mRNA decay